jgi:hypothetical protein
MELDERTGRPLASHWRCPVCGRRQRTLADEGPDPCCEPEEEEDE